MTKRKTISSDNKANVFTTYDLGVATALLTAGYKLKNLDRSNKRRALFVFRYKKGIEVSANHFFSNELHVKARSYFDHLKALKNKLYSE